MFNKINQANQIENYKKMLAAQVEERHKQEVQKIKAEVIKELKDYINEVVKVRNQ